MERAASSFCVAASAFLLFTVELLAARHLLPRFGGAAAVWLACLVFFQTLLLAGYAWSRLLAEKSRPAQRAHLALLAGALVTLALQSLRWGVPLLSPSGRATRAGTFEVVADLCLAVGLPFVALTATAPLVQAWHARRGGERPWRLYALSNAGALGALLTYPFVIEPLVGLRAQAVAWSVLFVLVAVPLGWLAWAKGGDQPAPAAAPAERPSAVVALTWVGLAAGGSFTLAAVTNAEIHDLVPAPMLWALPLAIYLLSFIVTFEHERWYRRDLAVLLTVAGLFGVMWSVAADSHGLLARCAAFAAFELGLCVICHGELYARRPAPAHLGRYYLWLAAGAALGTAVVSFAFPALTRDYVELPVLVAGAAVGCAMLLPERVVIRVAGWLALGSLVFGFFYAWNARRQGQAFTERNFFGVLRVERDGEAWVLIHGGTVHGRQPLEPSLAAEASTYYARDTALGLAVKSLHDRRAGPLSAAVLGLGIGTSAALFERGDSVVFYEIDPEVVSLAEGKGGWFGYLQRTQAAWKVELGDARTTLVVAPPPKALDLLVVDVFSGDAVPMHLLTEEALRTYLDYVQQDGLIAVHVSNRFFELDRVALSLAPRLGLKAVAYMNPPSQLAARAKWVLLARSEEALPVFKAPPGARVWRQPDRPAPWTDDLSSVLSVLR